MNFSIEMRARELAAEGFDTDNDHSNRWFEERFGGNDKSIYSDNGIKEIQLHYVEESWQHYAARAAEEGDVSIIDREKKPPGLILEEMAQTFRRRNEIYGDNYLDVGRVMEILHGPLARHPASSLVGSAEQFNVWHLYELMIVKLTRFANSGLTHTDSIHDAAVYAAMIESLIAKKEQA